jgi:hypothetical protein
MFIVLKIALGIVALFFAWQFYKYYKCWKSYLSYKRQGVVFDDAKGFSVFKDMLNLGRILSEYKTEFGWLRWTQGLCGGTTLLAPVSGFTALTGAVIQFNTVQHLEDIYVKNSQYHSKHSSERQNFSWFTDGSIILAPTDETTYETRRKALGTAFSRSKI